SRSPPWGWSRPSTGSAGKISRGNWPSRCTPPPTTRGGARCAPIAALPTARPAAWDEVRARLMPVNRAFDVEALMAGVKRYPLTTRQRVFFEYVMLDGVNDSPEEAQRLAKLLRGVKAKV